MRQHSPLTYMLASALTALSLGATTLVVGAPTASAATEEYLGATIGNSGTTLGSAAYAAPSGSIYASPQGSDSDPGSLDRPVRTVAKALTLAPAGGTIVLRAGSYHESVVVHKQVTIQNYPHEVAWFDGSSVVSNWTKSGSVWTAPWSTFFARSDFPGGTRSDYPNANLPAQVFIDGKALTEVTSAAQVSSGTFFADSSNGRLVIGSDPTGAAVRASDLDQAIAVGVQNVTFRGFGVQRYASNATSRAALLMDPDGGVFENLVVSDNSMVGLTLTGANKTIRNITAERNGMMGLSMDRADNGVVENSVLRYNNSERFPTQPVASGMKVTKAANLRIANNVVSDNYLAAGIWLDNYCRDAVIVGNTIVNNGEMGINFEAATRGIVADNVVKGGLKGIELRDTDRVKVMNNHVSGYTLMGIYLAQDERWKTLSTRPSDVPLLVRDDTLANNVIGCGTRFQIFGKDDSTNIPMDKFNVTITGNLFSPRVKSPELNMVAWGLDDNNSVDFLQSTAQLATKNSSWKNLQATDCVANPESGIAASDLKAIATPLPSDVAAAIGASAGLQTVGTIGTSAANSASNSAAATEPTANPTTPVLERPTTSGKKIKDSFSRKLKQAWGVADTGDKWSLSTDSTAFSTTGSRGVITLQTAGAAAASLNSSPSTSTAAAATLALNHRPAKGSASVVVVGRQVGAASYGATVAVSSSGRTKIFASKDGVQIGKAAVLKGKYRPGKVLHLRMDVDGTSPTTIRVRAWAAGRHEPSSWQVRTLDSSVGLQAPGTLGIGAAISNSLKSNVKAKISTFTALVRS